MNYQNFRMNSNKRPSEMTMFERAMHGPIKARKPKVEPNHNKTQAISKADLRIKGFESLKTKQTSQLSQSSVKRHQANNAKSSNRSASMRK